MRPIKLVVSAFGPYKDKVEVDFSSLEGVFLITGDTGSGKTSIFDAICYALYGEASGSKRDNSGFRSDFASDNVDTFVELEFVHKDVSYRVMRIPKYVRKKKRGEGVTSVGGDASLVYLDEVITGEKNVTDKCVEILGLNASQFKQVSMIAQGEFMDLLFSKSKDRATIFRHIFDTSIYKNISDKLKEMYLLKKREYEDTFISIKGYINSIQMGDVLSGEENTDEVLKLLSNEIKTDKKNEKVLDDERDFLFNEVSRIVKIITEGKIINDSIIDLETNKKRLSELLELKSDIEDKELVIKKNKDISVVILPKYNEYINVCRQLDEKNKLYSNNLEVLSNIDKEFNVLKKNYDCIKNKQDEILECNKVISDLNGKLIIFDEIEEINNKLALLNNKYLFYQLNIKKNTLNSIEDLKQRELEVSILRNEIIKLKDEYLNDSEVYNKHYDLFLSSQAGILASTLNDNEACPVCGSLEHPKLAVMVDEILSKEELDNEKILLDNKYKSLEDVRIKMLELEKNIEVCRKELVDIDDEVLRGEISILESKCNGFELDIDDINVLEVENDIKSNEIRLSFLKNSLGSDDSKEYIVNLINEKIDYVLNLEEEISIINKSYDDMLKKKSYLESMVDVIKKDILRLENEVIKAKDEYILSYKSLGYSDEDDYIKVKLEKDELLELETEVGSYREEVSSINSNIVSLEKIINGREGVSLDVYEEELKGVNSKLDKVNLSLKDISNKLSNNKKIYDKLSIINDKTKELERNVMIYKDLSDTANGTINGKNKVEFEQYVQASYFDRVLIMANKRFGMMTGERYELVRKEESNKISDKLGLELEVMDYFTGKRRGIKSLSGGESFKAALSLALGMSDAIQGFSGGVVVDAMFIDEGFGSLDDESLNQALNAIMMMSQDNKLIGIISHVNELKSRIDKKIVVKKSSNGSSISLVV